MDARQGISGMTEAAFSSPLIAFRFQLSLLVWRKNHKKEHTNHFFGGLVSLPQQMW